MSKDNNTLVWVAMAEAMRQQSVKLIRASQSHFTNASNQALANHGCSADCTMLGPALALLTGLLRAASILIHQSMIVIDSVEMGDG
jgi:hypothetical protein